jgi:hypothetical protein
MCSRHLSVPVLLLGAAFSLSPSPARAVPILITQGETVSEMGQVQPKHRNLPLPAMNVGFKYSYFGIFWLDLWTWDGTWCLHNGNQYWPLNAAQAAEFLGTSESELSTPFLYKFPLGLDIIAGIIVFACLKRVLFKPPPNPVAEVMQDARYRQAVSLFYQELNRPDAPAPAAGPQLDNPEGAPPAPPPDDGDRLKQKLEAAKHIAVNSLTQQGIPQAEAEEKLAVVLRAIESSSPGSHR